MKEAAIERPEAIGKYTKDLPLKIESEYQAYLEDHPEVTAKEAAKSITPEDVLKMVNAE